MAGATRAPAGVARRPGASASGGETGGAAGLRHGYGLPIAVVPGVVGGGRLGDGDRPLAVDVDVGQ